MVGVEERRVDRIVARCEAAISDREGFGRVERQYKGHVCYRAGIVDHGVAKNIDLGVSIRVHNLLEASAGYGKNTPAAVHQIGLEHYLAGSIDRHVLERREPAG